MPSLDILNAEQTFRLAKCDRTVKHLNAQDAGISHNPGPPVARILKLYSRMGPHFRVSVTGARNPKKKS